MEALRDLWDSLDERVQLHQSTVLSLLYEKLQVGVALLQGLNPMADHESSLHNLQTSAKGNLKKFKYASSTSRKLEKVMRELEKWQKIFDPSWYLLACTAGPKMSQKGASQDIFIIQELRRVHEKEIDPRASKSSIFLPHQYSIQETRPLANTLVRSGSTAAQTIIIDPLSVEGKDVQEATKDVRDIARVLAQVDPNIFGLLKCHGVMKRYESSELSGFDVIFDVPTEFANPRSLRSFLLTPDRRCSLDGRFRLARLLARSVSFLHTAQIVHKNISPETIVLLQSSEDGGDTPFLVGFEKFRHAEGRTYMSGDVDWQKNLYRHPKRQGIQPEEMYKMQHDIYSLGVCLLEIGLGFSFMSFEPEKVRYVASDTLHWRRLQQFGSTNLQTATRTPKAQPQIQHST